MKSMNKTRPILGITMGDPAGIGPEICVKALQHQEVFRICKPLIVGDAAVMQEAIRIAGADMQLHAINAVGQAMFQYGVLDVLDQNTVDIEKLVYGAVSTMAGEAAFQAVVKAIELAKNGEVNATVTAPLNKEALNKAGHNFSGHTEIYAQYTNTKEYGMMLVHRNLRVIHVSTHVSLLEACRLVKKERVFNVIRLADKSCRELGIAKPRVAVAGLNPHAGENGLFGDEEILEIIPAIEKAQELGINVTGPHPPDSIFSKANGGGFDIVVAMYHDQGHIPLKVVGFVWDEKQEKWRDVEGVNITLGLPIIRASVDHGTAFDQAGKGIASDKSMLNAIIYGVMLAKKQNLSDD